MSKALLVDDEEPILRLFGTILERDGFSVTTAGSASMACNLLRQNAYDIVVTDLKMETPSAGFDVVRASNLSRPRPVIVLLTAFPVPASQWRNAGADALIVKGEDTRGLPARLKALLAQQQQMARGTEKFLRVGNL
jgi:DNA-binding response OmpR family regulator